MMGFLIPLTLSKQFHLFDAISGHLHQSLKVTIIILNEKDCATTMRYHSANG